VKALILNSGLGSRMGEYTRDRPKGMVEIGGGQTIVSRLLTQLSAAGVSDSVITTGPFADTLRAHIASLGLPITVRYAHNPEYANTNYIVSIVNAAPLLQGDDVLLFHGDLVLEDSVLADLIRTGSSAVAVDSTLPLPEKDFKAKIQNGNVVAIGVEFFGEDCIACQPAYHLTEEAFSRWLAEMRVLIARGETRVYAENALNALDGALPLAPLELGGRLCAEIDNPDDLAAVSARLSQMPGEKFVAIPEATEGRTNG